MESIPVPYRNLSGWLFIQRLLGTWERVWGIHKDGVIYLLSDPHATIPKERMLISKEWTVQEEETLNPFIGSAKFTFRLSSPSSSTILAASSNNYRSNWIDTINF